VQTRRTDVVLGNEVDEGERSGRRADLLKDVDRAHPSGQSRRAESAAGESAKWFQWLSGVLRRASSRFRTHLVVRGHSSSYTSVGTSR